MNARRWLILSLALNVALGVAITRATLVRHTAVTPRPAAQPLTNRTIRVRKIICESLPAIVEVTAPFHWSEVESRDYRVYMQNLQAIGCPERTIRDLIVADVDDLFVERLRQLLAPLHREFWRLIAEMETDKVKDESKRYEEAWRALKEERAGVFKELLGHVNPFQADDEENRAAAARARTARLLDFLTPEKREGVVALREGVDEAKKQLKKCDHALTNQERKERQRQQRELEADHGRQLAELLTPEELAEYRLRNSPGADVCLRQSRVEFSEDELRIIARATAQRQKAEAEFQQNTPEANRQRAEVRQRAAAEIQKSLGEARYADYQRATDNSFEQISQVIERYSLPEQKGTAVYDRFHQAEAQARRTREGESRTVEERTASLQAIRAETERALEAELGTGAWATYRERGGDGWLNQLATPPGP
ncbi:MAG: hypothetical protein MUF81_00905 [Verrucomicrobia bacterium]|jgi:hypothetical protein|nr:hypothetical protein [Verrucomicrobiota bacterium]